MNTLYQRLKEPSKVDDFVNKFPSLGERLTNQLNELHFAGDLTLSVVVDLASIYDITHIADIYDLFESPEF